MLDRDRGLKALDRAMLFQMLAVEEDAKDIWSDCGNTIYSYVSAIAANNTYLNTM